MAPKFSDEQYESLVEETAKHPSLWQVSHPIYKDRRVKDTRAEVDASVGKPSEVHSGSYFTQVYFSCLYFNGLIKRSDDQCFNFLKDIFLTIFMGHQVT